MPSALLTADNGRFSIEAIKPTKRGQQAEAVTIEHGVSPRNDTYHTT